MGISQLSTPVINTYALDMCNSVQPSFMLLCISCALLKNGDAVEQCWWDTLPNMRLQVHGDKSYEWRLKTPPSTWLIKKATGEREKEHRERKRERERERGAALL